MLGRFKMIAVLLLVGAVALTGAFQLGKYKQQQQSAVDAAQSITTAIQNRAGINETIGDMDTVVLCLELGGVRAQCEQLRGLATD